MSEIVSTPCPTCKTPLASSPPHVHEVVTYGLSVENPPLLVTDTGERFRGKRIFIEGGDERHAKSFQAFLDTYVPWRGTQREND